ncbi:hypothetical protein N665_0184s0010 [Sinapis alba]|nr:hypothetical protein N665_0184s0010 [Sinapis alba]
MAAEKERKSSAVSNMGAWGMNVISSISKLSMIPVVCVMEWILHNKRYSKQVKLSVVIVVVGVAICTVTDVKVNAKGFVCACVAIFSSSLQQILIGSLKTAPIQDLSVLLVGPLVDYLLSGKFIVNYSMSSGCFLFILLSCALAVFCNISQYLCIRRFSAVSFQVIGHMKTVCILTLGLLLFDSAMTFKNVSGMFVAIVGMVIYSWAMELEKQSAKALGTVKHSSTEEEFEFLKEAVAEPTQSKDVDLGHTKA